MNDSLESLQTSVIYRNDVDERACKPVATPLGLQDEMTVRIYREGSSSRNESRFRHEVLTGYLLLLTYYASTLFLLHS